MPIFGNPYARTPAGVLRKLNEKWRRNPLDPTIGYTTEQTGYYYQHAGRIVGLRTEAISEDGTADSIIAYITNEGQAKRHKCAIYNYSSKAFLGVTAEITVPIQSFAWVTFNFSAPKPSLVNGTRYFICTWAESNTGEAWMGYAAITGWQHEHDDLAYDSFPDPWAPDGTSANRAYSIYCTYTPAALPVVKRVLKVDHGPSPRSKLIFSPSLKL